MTSCRWSSSILFTKPKTLPMMMQKTRSKSPHVQAVSKRNANKFLPGGSEENMLMFRVAYLRFYQSSSHRAVTIPSKSTEDQVFIIRAAIPSEKASNDSITKKLSSSGLTIWSQVVCLIHIFETHSTDSTLRSQSSFLTRLYDRWLPTIHLPRMCLYHYCFHSRKVGVIFTNYL